MKLKRTIFSFLPAFAILLAVLFFSPVTSKAATKTGTCGDSVSYSYDTDTKELRIYGSGAMKDYLGTNTPWRDYADDILTVTIQSGVTRIGNGAFGYGYGITSITIPYTVTSIGWKAFWGCSALESITLPYGITKIENNTFDDCDSLKTINIPDSVTSIGEEAFLDCKSLEQIKIPNSVTTIGDCAFYGCDNLIVAEIPKSVTNIGYDAFGYTYYLDYQFGGAITEKVPGFYIITESGSAAESYAKDNGFDYWCKIGDKIPVPVPKSKSFIYNGEAQTGVPGDDRVYTITGNTAKDAGSYTAKLSLKSGFIWADGTTADKKISWKIDKLSIDSASIKVSDQRYSPNVNPSLTVKVGEIWLAKGTDFDVSLSNHTGLGIATVTITGKGSCVGTASTSFAIYPASVESASVTIPEQKYTGKELRPDPTVKMGSYILEKGKDYTVSYSNNIDVGNADIVIEGEGNYTGSISATFSIVPTECSVTVSDDGNGIAMSNLTTGLSGTEVSLAVMPKDGYKFKEWQVIKGGVTVTNNKFTIGGEDVEIKAIFELINNVPELTSTPAPTTTAIPTATTVPTVAAPTATAVPENTAAATATPAPTAAVTTATKETPTVTPVNTDVAEAKKGDVVADAGSKASYLITSDSSVAYVSVQDNVTNVTVPAEVKIGKKKYKVTEIKANAFKNNKKLKKVTIGKNIKKIGKNAFYGCKNLKKITVKTALLTKKSVGKNAFKGINAKAVVKVPKKKLKVYKPILKKAGIKGKGQKISK